MPKRLYLRTYRHTFLQSLFPIIVLVCTSPAKAETLESFTLNATLIDASGPEKITAQVPYCREGGETPGVTENWGTVTLSYDEAMGTASVMNWTGTGATTINKADGNGDKIFIATFSFNTAGSNGSKPGFSSKYSESIRAGYVNRNAPSFRGSYIEKTSTTDLNTGKTANCEFKYQLWGGTGDVPQDSSEPYDPSLLSIIVEKLKPFILDNTRSRNTTPVTKRTAALGVRG